METEEISGEEERVKRAKGQVIRASEILAPPLFKTMGFAVVYVYKTISDDAPCLDFISQSEVSGIPEQRVIQAINALNTHLMGKFGKAPPKKRLL